MSGCEPSVCAGCSMGSAERLKRLGLNVDKWDYSVALAGNPNTGKSTIFNALTGLRQHTGNWPGKTITRAEGGFSYGGGRFKIVDLPGTYSLLSASPDEEVARDFILFGRPDVTVVVVDATRLERNLNLVLQILQITDRALVCLNLMDEARARKMTVDARGLARDLGVPVVPTAARQGEGVEQLLAQISAVATREVECQPRQLAYEVPGLGDAVEKVARLLKQGFPHVPQPKWISWRLLEGDQRVIDAVATGELGSLVRGSAPDMDVVRSRG